MSDFICPVCGGSLSVQNRSYVCSRNHCFDISAKGYVNLLMSGQSKNKRHGDDALMLRAREKFLAGGLYSPMRDAVASVIPENSRVLDIGCGEGYYTDYICRAGNCAVTGIDISKEALILAHKRNPSLSLAVASVSSLPVADESADVLVNIFAPEKTDEFLRVLKKDGLFIKVVPLEKHLYELKAAIYEKPYENKVVRAAPDGFRMDEFRELKYAMSVGGEDLRNLFMMTPYYYKTGTADQQKLLGIEQMEITAEFGIAVMRKQ